ncbi:hypothetical protein Ahy_B03g063124 [Arachis hypogaea]|uniref:Uncharacterized protein n=1 Tax=Arachis hypogaea TaxID=3818 RepID=A0A444ZWA6_ARAHY|nr:hypothetical protein Ahy_B03g063124 [Arachis hypogaea]
MFWFDSTAPDLEFGLHVMRGDIEINDIRNNKSKNKKTNEIYIYVDHPVSVPEVVDEEKQAKEVILSDSSSSNDGYETTEDEPYKPPPPEYEDTHSSEDSKERRRKERLKKKEKMVSPRKRARQGSAGEVKSGPNRKLIKSGPNSRDKAGPSKGGPGYSPKTAKKRASKKYSGRRRTHIPRNEKTGVECAEDEGPKAGGDVGSENGLARNTMGSNSEIFGEELDSDYDKPYEYERMPYRHAVAALAKMGLKAEDFVYKWLTMDAIRPKQEKPRRTCPKSLSELAQRLKIKEKKFEYHSLHHKLRRSPAPCFVPPPIPAPGPTLWLKSQPSQTPNLMPHTSQNQSNDSIVEKTSPRNTHDVISQGTMAAATSTIASRLLKFVPTPDFKPPRLRPPKQG